MDDRALVRVLKALADANRFRMLRQIAAAGELSCGQLGARFALAQPTMSHHLKILIAARLVDVRNDGALRLLSVERALLDRAAALLPRRVARRPRGKAGPARRRPRRA
jgi:ArsR family transcriptional regulator